MSFLEESFLFVVIDETSSLVVLLNPHGQCIGLLAFFTCFILKRNATKCYYTASFMLFGLACFVFIFYIIPSSSGLFSYKWDVTYIRKFYIQYCIQHFVAAEIMKLHQLIVYFFFRLSHDYRGPSTQKNNFGKEKFRMQYIGILLFFISQGYDAISFSKEHFLFVFFFVSRIWAIVFKKIFRFKGNIKHI